MDPEIGVINKAITGNLHEIRLLGINDLYFQRWLTVWQFVEGFFEKNKKVPEAATVLEHFPKFFVVETPEPASYYVERLVASLQIKSYVTYVDNLNTALKNRDMEKARQLTTQLYSDVAYHSSETGDLVGSAEIKRSGKIIENVKAEFATAITTGFSSADEEIGGWRQGEFIGIVAPPYTGKSWTIFHNAKEIVAGGGKVVIGSCEMPKEEIWLRFMALYFNLPAKRLLQGRLTEVEERKVRKLIKQDLPGEIYIIGGHDISGVDLLRRKIYQYAPDIVFWDSWYGLIPGGGRHSRWEELTGLASDFKRLALDMQVPIVVTHQMGREGATKQKGKLTDIAGSFDIVGCLDVAFCLVLNEDLRRTRELGIICRKHRKFDPFSFAVKFNVNEGEDMSVSRETWILEEAAKSSPVGLTDEDLERMSQSGF